MHIVDCTEARQDRQDAVDHRTKRLNIRFAFAAALEIELRNRATDELFYCALKADRKPQYNQSTLVQHSM